VSTSNGTDGSNPAPSTGESVSPEAEHFGHRGA
jgi:hypothetical protein